MSNKVGLKDFSNYLLYNFDDHPDDLYHRLRINVESVSYTHLVVAVRQPCRIHRPAFDGRFYDDRTAAYACQQTVAGVVKVAVLPGLGVQLRNDGSAAVSYTHLDVYKRQGYVSSPSYPRPFDPRGASAAGYGRYPYRRSSS